jgi:hypothetical protein
MGRLKAKVQFYDFFSRLSTTNFITARITLTHSDRFPLRLCNRAKKFPPAQYYEMLAKKTKKKKTSTTLWEFMFFFLIYFRGTQVHK